MELIKLLPDYYAYNETMKELQSIVSGETDSLDVQLTDTINQCSVDNSTWALTRWEKMLGIMPDIIKTDQYRRERLKAKIAGAGTTTKSLIESIARSYTNAEVEIVEHCSDYSLTVRFVGTIGIPKNIDDVKLSIEEAVPAHLAVDYEYIYNTYAETGRFTHGELSGFTHYQIRSERHSNAHSAPPTR